MGAVPSPFQEDLEFLFTTIFEVHPRPDFRVPPARLEAERRVCLARAAHCTSAEELWAIAQPFLHLLGDGHTALTPPASPAVRQAPVRTTWVAGQVVVERVLEEDGEGMLHSALGRGDVILAVDGQEVERRLDDLVAAVAYNHAGWARRRAARQLLQFVGTDQTHVELLVARAAGEVVATRVPLWPADHPLLQEDAQRERRDVLLRCVEGSFPEDLEAGLLRLRRCIAPWALRLPGFADWLQGTGLAADDVSDAEETCWAFFQELHRRRLRRLIVDLRGNEGGNSAVAWTLCKYLTRQPLQHFRGEVRCSRQLQAVDERYRREPVGTLKTYPGRPLAFPYFSRLDTARLEALRPFEGEVFVLIDTDVFSAGEEAAALLRCNGIGTFVGEPTGGGGSVPGTLLRFQLPHTKLWLGVASTFSYLPQGAGTSYPGVLPHYWVPPSLADYRAGRDVALDLVRALIR